MTIRSKDLDILFCQYDNRTRIINLSLSPINIIVIMAYAPTEADLETIDNATHSQVVQFYAFKTWWSNDEAVASVMGSRTALLEAVSNFTKMAKYSKETLKASIVSDADKAKQESQQTAGVIFGEEEVVAITDVSTATVSWIPYIGNIALAINIAVHVGMEEEITEKKRELDEQLKLSSESSNWLTSYPEVQSALNLTKYMVDLGKESSTGDYVANTIMGYVQDKVVKRIQMSVDEVKGDFDAMSDTDGVLWMSFRSDAVDSLIAADEEDRTDFLDSLETLRTITYALTLLRGTLEAGEKLWQSFKTYREARNLNKANNDVIRLEDPEELDEMRMLVDENKVAPWKKTEEVAESSIETEAKVLAIFQIILGVTEGVVAYVERSQLESIIEDVYNNHADYADAVAAFWDDVSSD
ncbi:hypothetical protein FGB62_229g010 [Gracilaria domingensis]|nr:hypothetical protein FGB62_229g010 [Gracilaria domingensis]